jgi:hypothetical protein
MLFTNTRFIPSSGGLVFGASAEVIFEGGLSSDLTEFHEMISSTWRRWCSIECAPYDPHQLITRKLFETHSFMSGFCAVFERSSEEVTPPLVVVDILNNGRLRRIRVAE